MSSKYDYSQVVNTGIVDNTDASLNLVSSTDVHSDRYLYIEDIDISVVEAAAGGDGILEIKEEDDGEIIYTLNVDGVKDIHLKFGDDGKQLTLGKGVQFVVSGASLKQARVSVLLVGHYSYKEKV